MSDGIERAIDEAERLFIEAGTAKAEVRKLDMRRKRIRAAMFIKHKATAKSVAEAQELAECDPAYEIACVELEQADLKSEVLGAQAEAKRLRFEAWRTQSATERAAMNLR